MMWHISIYKAKANISVYTAPYMPLDYAPKSSRWMLTATSRLLSATPMSTESSPGTCAQ